MGGTVCNLVCNFFSIHCKGEQHMALKDTVHTMKRLLEEICKDLCKASESGNKAAAQRVRTGTIKLEKLAKTYRKESISQEKKQGPKRAVKKPKAAPKKTMQMKRATAKIPSKKRR